jgi:tetratricopeptide (TPR) repeat protein
VGYLGYYAAWVLLSYGLRQPWLLAGILVLWLSRGFVPTPGALFGGLGKVRRLRQQVELNRANVTARRDLATIYLNLLKPQRAFDLLEEGLALSPGDPELTYLSAVALHKLGRYEEALARLLAAIEKDSRLRQGHPYFVAGETLLALGRFDDAVDAFERYLDFNSSDVAAHTLLARAFAGAKNDSEAKRWLAAGIKTWYGLPGAHKRKQFGAYCAAQWAKISVLKDPVAMAVGLMLVAALALLGRATYPLVARLWEPKLEYDFVADSQRVLSACGKVPTGEFAGNYQVRDGHVTDDAPPADATILRDRIVIDAGQAVQELCLVEILERQPGALHARAVERLHEPGWEPATAGAPVSLEPGFMVDLRMSRGKSFTRLSVAMLNQPMSPTLIDLVPKP